MHYFKIGALAASATWSVAMAGKIGKRSFDVFDYVDPLTGTSNGGHVFPGATLPFGMAKAVADVDDPNEKQGGFASGDSNINGFSHMHDSGTGGSPSLGNFPIFPQSGCPGDIVDNCFFTKTERASQRINGSIEAHPGYFAVSLNTSIKAEMTVSNHTVLYRFTFPLNQTGLPNSPLILVDLTDLPDSITNGRVEVDEKTGRLQGNGTFAPSFGIGTYNLSFCADFSGAPLRDSGVWMNNRAGSYPKSLRRVADGVNSPPLPAGAWTQFNATEDNEILVRVGVSFISNEQACSNAEKEIPDFDFEDILSSAEDAWRDKLSVVEVDATGVSDELQTVFWSGMYRSMISPQDYTGENYLWNSTEPYYDSYYCIWDSFRSIHPLLTLLDPQSQTLMVRSLIDIYRHEGKLPDCRMSLCKGFTQGGSNADVVLTDSYLKNITLNVDWNTAYEALVSDAEVEPLDWSIEGRGGLGSWKEYGYIPTDDWDPYGVGPFTRSISRTVEYAYDDFCIAEMAKGLGNTQDAEKYVGRSSNWKNMLKADQTSFVSNTTNHPNSTVDSGFVGFLQPRYLNQTWGFQDPSLCSPLYNFTSCYLNSDGHETYEGSSWMYTFFVPQDMATLVTTLGGPDTFTKRLSYLHTSGLLYIGDEQAFLPVFQFHYAGRPGLSAYFSHFYIPSQFNTSTSGLAGNDDSGAMGSFTTLAMMGLWPISGQNVYLITPPYFPEISVTNGQTGNTATVRNVNFDPDYEAIYIQSATLNGEPYAKNWIAHDFWLNGGVLELTLGMNESDWGTGAADLPPSSSTSF
ncbi:glycoside hydrolase family 92 protein [Mollisia scopiformis]|uniref:Glycoside hydrolase family 92 protein n=1 Tax=Mollisia scopiformis TaxID=149040 RepID=A0A194XUK6_MOLSC|nr:glycoside hydrolase family 92 protein [Mollisia scopiformis]KUJ23719.1 glycoside hydrolase family 92 protein [Mollisia scopiformis]